jgi:hypothetical protein
MLSKEFFARQCFFSIIIFAAFSLKWKIIACWLAGNASFRLQTQFSNLATWSQTTREKSNEKTDFGRKVCMLFRLELFSSA